MIKELTQESNWTLDTDIKALLQAYLNQSSIKDFESLSEYVDIVNRNIYIGDIEEVTGAGVDAFIRFYNIVDKQLDIPVEDRIPIKIFINSDGGDLTATFTIIDSIHMSKTPVYTINQGRAYSGGYFIYICGHKRYSFSSSNFLFHEGSTVMGGDAHKFESAADYYKKKREKLRQIVLDHTKISPELYDEKKKDDWWFDTEEAEKLGMVEVIVTPENYDEIL